MPYAFSMGHTYLEIRGHQLCNILIKLRSSMALATVDSLIYGSQSSNFIFLFIPPKITALFECWKLSVYRWCRFTTSPNFSCLPFVLTIHAFLSFPQIPNPAENPHYNWYSHKFPNPTYSLNPLPKCLLCPPTDYCNVYQNCKLVTLSVASISQCPEVSQLHSRHTWWNF